MPIPPTVMHSTQDSMHNAIGPTITSAIIPDDQAVTFCAPVERGGC